MITCSGLRRAKTLPISSKGFHFESHPPRQANKGQSSNVRRDLQSRRSEYQDLQSENRIKNTPCRWIANPLERKIR